MGSKETRRIPNHARTGRLVIVALSAQPPGVNEFSLSLCVCVFVCVCHREKEIFRARYHGEKMIAILQRTVEACTKLVRAYSIIQISTIDLKLRLRIEQI